MSTTSIVIDSVHLRVSNLARSLDFYTRQLGFVVTARTHDGATLGTDEKMAPLLQLTQTPGAARAEPGSAGLFHAAVLLPSRAALGAWLQYAIAAKVEFEGFTDHGVSEAIYLSDPDGNGLEFYADRPRAAWPRRNGELQMMTAPLNLQNLLAAATPAAPAPLSGATWGHLHLRVSDLDRAQAFYSSTLGLELTQRFGASARFLSADGYHHHLGINTWGAISKPQDQAAAGLIDASVRAKTVTTPNTVRDPDGITFHIKPR